MVISNQLVTFEELLEGCKNAVQRFVYYKMSLKQDREDVLQELADRDKEILYIHYIQNKKQDDIAKRLNIPVGTVKSRLYKAKERFKEYYPYPPVSKGENNMIKFLKVMPEVKIELVGETYVYWYDCITDYIL